MKTVVTIKMIRTTTMKGTMMIIKNDDNEQTDDNHAECNDDNEDYNDDDAKLNKWWSWITLIIYVNYLNSLLLF